MTESSFPLSLLVTAIALIGVLIVAWLSLKLLANLGSNKFKGGRIKVLASAAVGTRERIVLAQVDNKEYLLGVSAGGITLLEKSDSYSSAPSPERR